MTKCFTWAFIFIALFTLSGCPGKKKYVVAEQVPADYITSRRGPDDLAVHDDEACRWGIPKGGGAYEYLEVLVDTGGRRSGTQGYRCAAAFCREALKGMGYRVEEMEYGFPYYRFDLDDFQVTRQKDGREFPACPMHFGMPIGEVRVGKVVRPRKNLTGCFVYVNPEEPWTGSVLAKYETWKDNGALGVIREATMKPLAGRGNRHSARAHTTSWHYAPLPGLVVENARKLLGDVIEVRGDARIVRGTGHTVVAMSPAPADSYVVVTAHLDCWFTGALDDGTGSAALLEAARLLKDDPHGVIFLLADTEEIGLIGSAVFAQRFDLDKVAAVIELDMVSGLNNYGWNKSPDTARIMPRFITYTRDTKPRTKSYLDGLGGTKLYFPMGLTRKVMGGLATDMEWFYAHGVPGVFVYSPSKYYHTELDNIDWIPADDLQRVAEAVAGLTRDFRDDPPPPPKDVIPFEISATLVDDEEVELAIIAEGGYKIKNAVVNCYFEMGYEDRVKLAPDDDGTWRGVHSPPWPGHWQYLGMVSKGKQLGKRWATVDVPPFGGALQASHARQ